MNVSSYIWAREPGTSQDLWESPSEILREDHPHILGGPVADAEERSLDPEASS